MPLILQILQGFEYALGIKYASVRHTQRQSDKVIMALLLL